MKALILTCNTGQGHNSVAAAVEVSLLRRGEECDITDALAFLSQRASDFISSWHVRIYRYMPKVFRSGYKMAENHPSAFEEDSRIYKLIESGIDRLRDYVVSGGYDCLICPHVISAVMVTMLKNKYPELNLLTCNVATDYTCSPMTEESALDLYFIPDESVLPEFLEAGIPKERLALIDGIPVRRDFYRRTPKNEAKAELGIPVESPHLIMMFGSMGCGPVDKLTVDLIEKLHSSAFVTIVCGTNRTLQRKLEWLCEFKENFRVEGYVDDISLLMDSADLYITKPGGISVSEAAVKQLPMLLVDTVAGCEEYNLRLFLDKGAAVTADGIDAQTTLCTALLCNGALLEAMRQNLPPRKNSADQIAARLCEEFSKRSGEE